MRPATLMKKRLADFCITHIQESVNARTAYQAVHIKNTLRRLGNSFSKEDIETETAEDDMSTNINIALKVFLNSKSHIQNSYA